jgi:hypothetical protein
MSGCTLFVALFCFLATLAFMVELYMAADRRRLLGGSKSLCTVLRLIFTPSVAATWSLICCSVKAELFPTSERRLSCALNPWSSMNCLIVSTTSGCLSTILRPRSGEGSTWSGIGRQNTSSSVHSMDAEN